MFIYQITKHLLTSLLDHLACHLVHLLSHIEGFRRLALESILASLSETLPSVKSINPTPLKDTDPPVQMAIINPHFLAKNALPFSRGENVSKKQYACQMTFFQP